MALLQRIGFITTLDPAVPPNDGFVNVTPANSFNYGEHGITAGIHYALRVKAFLKTNSGGNLNAICILRDNVTGADLEVSSLAVITSAVGEWITFPLSGRHTQTNVTWFVYTEAEGDYGTSYTSNTVGNELRRHDKNVGADYYNNPSASITTLMDNSLDMNSYYEYTLGDLPVVTLVGGASDTTVLGTPYTDPGATAADTEDGVISPASIVVTGTVNHNALGTYPIDYDVDDADGQSALTVTRSVTVVVAPTPVIDNIDTDNNVYAGQGGVLISATFLDTLPISQVITLGGEPLTVTNWNSGDPVVDIPLDINLEWGATHTLSITDDVGTVVLAGITLSPSPLWSTQVFDGTIPTGNQVSLYSEAIADVGYTAVAGDIFAWETQDNLVFDAALFARINPADSKTFNYWVWDETLDTWSTMSSGTFTNGGLPPIESVKPVITINGNNPLVWILDTPWVDPLAVVTDNTDATRSISADTVPPTNAIGSFPISYNTQDVAGNIADTVVLTVNVVSSDTTPDQFTFLDIANADINTLYTNVQEILSVAAGQILSVTNGEVSNDNGVTWLSSVQMITGSTFVRATVTTGNTANTPYSVLVTVNGISATFTVTTIANVFTTFTIEEIRNPAGALINFTYPIWEIWTQAPEEGGTVLDSGVNAVVTNGIGSLQSGIVQAGIEYLLILRIGGNKPTRYVRQWGLFT